MVSECFPHQSRHLSGGNVRAWYLLDRNVCLYIQDWPCGSQSPESQCGVFGQWLTSVAMSKPSSKRLLLSEESVEDDFENEDEEGKAPLIKESRLVPSNGRVASGKKIRFKLSNGTSSLAEDEDGDGGCSGEEGGQSKHSLNTAPPITIGKVRIFQSTRRHRALRFRRFVKRCFALLVFALGLLLLAANANRLPELIRFLLGVHTARPARKDIEARCDQVASEPVWRQNFPMLTVESSLRLLHVNNDSVLDVIVPFGTGIDAAYYDSVLCQIYFNQTEAESKGKPCWPGSV